MGNEPGSPIALVAASDRYLGPAIVYLDRNAQPRTSIQRLFGHERDCPIFHSVKLEPAVTNCAGRVAAKYKEVT